MPTYFIAAEYPDKETGQTKRHEQLVADFTLCPSSGAKFLLFLKQIVAWATSAPIASIHLITITPLPVQLTEEEVRKQLQEILTPFATGPKEPEYHKALDHLTQLFLYLR